MANDNDNAIHRKVGRMYAFSELLEILAAAALAFSLFPINENLLGGVLIAVLLVLGSIALKLTASFREKDIVNRRREEESHSLHVVTPQRLKTLQAVGAGEDIVDVLSLRLGMEPLRGDELVDWLEGMLGHERVQEKIEIVRRYTRTTEEELGKHQETVAHQGNVNLADLALNP